MSRSVTKFELDQRLREARDLIDFLLNTRSGAFDICDCKHRSMDHGFIREGVAVGWRPCLVAGCDCTDFDTTSQLFEEFERKRQLCVEEAKREQTEQQMKRAA